MGYIAEAERKNVRTHFLEAKFLSILCDGSTDSAVVEEEIIYAQYTKKGEMFSNSFTRNLWLKLMHSILQLL